MKSYNIKKLRATFIMAQGYFSGDNNAVIIDNLPITASISKPGGEDKNKMNLEIQGLALDKIEQLTALAFRPLQTFNNIITLEAGIEDNYKPVFTGEISMAYGDFNNEPNISFVVEAITGIYPAKIASPPTSVQGKASVAELMQQFASEAGYSFVNEGVTLSVKNSIFSGSPLDKARALVRQAGIKMLVDDGAIVILPAGKPKNTNAVYLSKETGLIGYPTFSNDGISVKALYDPAFELEGLLEINSIVPKAKGVWRIISLTHQLEANFYNASAWQTQMEAVWVQE